MKHTLVLFAIVLSASCTKTIYPPVNPLANIIWVSTEDATHRYAFTDTKVLVGGSNLVLNYHVKNDTIYIDQNPPYHYEIKNDTLELQSPGSPESYWYKY